MSKIAVVYWSGTGNTETMAEAVAEGAKASGADVTVFTSANFTADQVAEYDAIGFGCPSMGAEELEETEFEPMFSQCEGVLGDKKIVLFGSYDWGDGEWRRLWEDRVRGNGSNLVADGYICNLTPDDDALAACKELGAALV